MTIIPACHKKVSHYFLAELPQNSCWKISSLPCPQKVSGFFFPIGNCRNENCPKMENVCEIKIFDFCRGIWKYNYLVKLPDSHMGAILWRIHLISLMSQTSSSYHFYWETIGKKYLFSSPN